MDTVLAHCAEVGERPVATGRGAADTSGPSPGGFPKGSVRANSRNLLAKEREHAASSKPPEEPCSR